MDKPLLIIVCGRPGSGKTTLARKLAREIRCPLISRDEFKEGYINTAEKAHSDAAAEEIANVNACFFEALKLLACRNISCVAEAAFQHKLWFPQYAELSEKAAIKLVICKADNAAANKRYLDRNARDPLRIYFHGEAAIARAEDEFEYRPPQFPAGTLEVDTSNGYKPDLKEILSFARKKQTPQREGR